MYDNYLYFPATAALYTLSVVTVLVLLAGVIASTTLWMKGKAPSLHHPLNAPAIIKAFVLECLLQVQILRISVVRWLMHFCIFIGFLGLFAQTALMAFMSHFVPPDTFIAKTFFVSPESRLGGAGARVLDMWGDVFGLLLLIGLAIAIIRRYVLRLPQLETLLKDTLSLTFLTVIALTGFLCEGLRLTDPAYADVARYSFVGNLLAALLKNIGWSAASYQAWVWTHAVISLAFCAYIPFSKAWHIFVSPLEIVLDASERA
ncbi:MAG: respiratory nitrate reductase subunit gamma [Desulfobacterota bacterium]|nr:respiratory nitrate reductase subunit gamma [Thermodesulfobacteriota bacterium]